MAKPDPAVFRKAFDTLKTLLTPYQRRFTVIVDKPGAYYLSTKTSKTVTGAATWFGGVQIKKNYVSFHLIPVYANPALLKGVSPSLLKRMQGKACFNFTAIEPAHLNELKALTKTGTAERSASR